MTVLVVVENGDFLQMTGPKISHFGGFTVHIVDRKEAYIKAFALF